MRYAIILSGLLAIVFAVMLARQGSTPSDWWRSLRKAAVVFILSNMPIALLLLLVALDTDDSVGFRPNVSVRNWQGIPLEGKRDDWISEGQVPLEERRFIEAHEEGRGS